MHSSLIVSGPEPSTAAIPLRLVLPGEVDAVCADLDAAAAAWVVAQGFKAAAGSFVAVPGPDGQIAEVLAGADPDADMWLGARLATALPEGVYAVQGAGAPLPDATLFAVAWGLAAYRFDRYRKRQDGDGAKGPRVRLVCPDGADAETVAHLITATAFTRDLINTPAEDMGPADLFEAAEKLATEFGGSAKSLAGNQLLEKGYPAIFTVGRASDRPPRLIDLRWGDRAAPKLTLVGKGVCFDTGGLDLKPSSGMRLMKKDMGGAAAALGLARLIMAAGLPVCLRVLIPAVDNAVAGNAYRPGDVVRTRKGLSVEIGNTDAEGRVVLADALTEAGADSPDLLIDLATLTGAARVALGPDLPVLFSNRDDLANGVLAAGTAVQDPLWRLPLWKPYRKMIDSDIADISNSGDSPFAGAITAALFLQDFVEPETDWLHIDTYGWQPSTQPGRPAGGAALAIRALFAYLSNRFGGR